MKNARYIMVAILVVAACTLPAIAQTSSTKVNIPFNFQVGTTILPAGDYTIAMFTDKAIVLQHKDGCSVAVSLTNAVAADTSMNRPHFLFNRYGKQHFLSVAWLRNTDGGRAVVVSEAEREIASRVRQTRTILLASN